MGIKGYKVFNPDWTCRGFQYEVGKTFTHNGDIKICEAGFHFCEKAADCFKFYNFNPDNKIAEVEAIGKIISSDYKSVTDRIVIVRELSWHEVLDLVNTGNNCTGYENSGDYNSGNCNSGDYNSGNRNSGECNSGYENSGDYNSGDYNSGNYNSGDYNSGDYNSGNCNSGNYNSGDYNSGNFSTGFFNSINTPTYAFNKPLSCSREEFCNNKGLRAMFFKHSAYNDTDEPLNFKAACRLTWSRLRDDERESVKRLPNFDAKIFEEITGIKMA